MIRAANGQLTTEPPQRNATAVVICSEYTGLHQVELGVTAFCILAVPRVTLSRLAERLSSQRYTIHCEEVNGASVLCRVRGRRTMELRLTLLVSSAGIDCTTAGFSAPTGPRKEYW